MRALRFFWRLYLGSVGVLLLAIGTVGVLVDRRVERDSLEETRTHLAGIATVLLDLAARPLAGDGPEDFQDRVEALGDETGLRLTVLLPDGKVIADSEEDPGLMEPHDDRPEIVLAARDGVGSATRWSRTVSTDMMYLARRVGPRDRPAGFVRAAVPLDAIARRQWTIRGIVVFGGVVGAGAGLALGFVLVRRVARPVESMTRAAEAIAAGVESHPVVLEGTDEIARLSRAIDRMAASLRDRMEAIAGERNRLAAILGGMVEGVIAVDRDERIVHMNRLAAELLGVEPGDVAGRPIWEVTRVSGVVDSLRSALEEGEEERVELRLSRTLRDRIVESVASPLRDGEGRVAGAVLVLHDVTELRRLEEVRRDFVANVSHELKTPVSAIRGLVETILDDPSMDEATRLRFLEKTRNQSDRLATLVADLLTLSRLESESGAIERETLDLREPVAQAGREFAAVAADRGLALEVRLPDEPLTIEGNRPALRQIADNLVDNAIKYTPRGGRVEVRLRRDGEGALLEVEDTGIGIEPGDQDRVFERFYRVDKARSRDLGGTGLGLSIVKHGAVAHGGRVWVESIPGRGSTFRVWLPLA